MSALTLTLKEKPQQRLDLSALTPDRLQGLDVSAIERIEIRVGNRRLSVGDLFAVTAGDRGTLRILNSGGKLDRIGCGMTGGSITVEGDAGAYLGQAMSGGYVVVQGNVGPGAAMEMRGGIIEIDGNAGDFVGGVLPGDMKGMSGGLVVLRGNAGARVGDRMRRGTILVEGNVGDYAASRMIAGTIIVLGADPGAYPGLGMKRGSLILRGHPERELPSFGDCGRHDLGFLRLLLRALHGRSIRLDQLAARPTQVRRLVGDQAGGGTGEILIWQD